MSEQQPVGERQIRRALVDNNTQLDPLELVVAAFGEADGWRVDRHPRFVVQRPDGRVQIVGFADDGVWVSLREQLSTRFSPPTHVLSAFGFEEGGWRVDRHPRFVTDTTGDGRRLDIVGFADDGVWISRQQSGGRSGAPEHVLSAFGFEAGGWRVDRHPRFLADTTGDGRADIVGFADDGVWISRAQPDGSFSAPEHVVAGFGFAAEAGGWQVDRHPRLMADTTGDGRADIVGFGNDGVWIARAQPDGSFTAQAAFVPGFGYAAAAGGWRVERHPRLMADTTGFGRADIVGFGNDGVWLSRQNPDGSFTAPEFLFANFGYNAGWRVERHPRLIADNSTFGFIGFLGAGVWAPHNRAR